jgi:hypothetical protein
MGFTNQRSDFGLFRDLQRIVDLDAKVTHGRFQLRMAQEQLHGTTTGSALTITAVSLTNPCRVTLSAVTALNKGDVITISGVVGTT